MINKEYLNKLNVLYVEDELEAANKLSKFLNRIFNEIYYCPNGKEALDVFNKSKIDLVISDINMPLMDGLELSEKIKQINPDTPILLTTARTEASCLIKAIELNIDSYLLKPIELDLLIDKIYSVCEKIEAHETKKLMYQYKDAIDESSIVMKFNLEGKITYVNKQYEELSGFTQNSVRNQFFNFNSLEDEPSSTFLDIWEVLESNGIWKGKLTSQTIEKRKYVLDSTIIPIRDYTENIIEYISISNDITEEEGLNKLLEVELKKYKGSLTSKTHLLNEYKRCLDNSTILINLNKKFKVVNANSKFISLIEKDLNSFIDVSLSKIIGEESFQDVFANLVDKKTKKTVVTLALKDEQKIYIDFTFSPVFNEDEEVIEYLAVGNDITEIIKLQQEIELTQKDLIETLGEVVESKSKETKNHVKRVALYSYILAKEYGLSEEDAQLLKLASPMHDIGKIAIDDSILKKPSTLTSEEYEKMKEHTSIGYKMFNRSKRKILNASSIVAHEHHEKWDGTGYPNGLKGEQIHIFGRITSVADVFDALNSKRCYKDKWEIEDIKNFFHERVGKDFEPKIVNILFEKIDQFLKINKELSDC